MSSFRSRGLLAAFAMIFAVLLVTAALAYVNVRRLYEHQRLVARSHEVLSDLRLLVGMLAEAESATRRFVMTSDPAALQPYEAAALAVPETIGRIEMSTADNPRQQASLPELRHQSVRRLEFMRRALEATREEGPEAGGNAIRKDEGQKARAAAADLIRQMEREEARLLTQRVGEASVRYVTAVVSSLVSAMLGLALAAVGFAWTHREMKAREQRAIELRETNERLEERVRQRTAALTEANQALRDEVAERHRAEQTIRLVAQDLERSNRELAHFAAVASHDLHEPLRKIEAFGDRLYGRCHDQLDEKGREYLQRMLVSSGRMRELIDGLLEYARVSSREQPPLSVELTRVAQDVVADLEARIQQSGGHVEIEQLPTIVADPLQMRQLLQNLIGNALKFHRPSEPPQVRVFGRLTSGTVRGASSTVGGDIDSQPAALCELTVEDNGVGFEPTQAERVFELFQRLHGREAYEGTGMGLAICKKIVERHGGRICAASRPGQGSRFLVTLPVAPMSTDRQA